MRVANSSRQVKIRLRRLPEFVPSEGPPTPELVIDVPCGQDEDLVLGRLHTKTGPRKMDGCVSTEHCRVRRCGGNTRPWMEARVLGTKLFVRRADRAVGDLAVFSRGSTAKLSPGDIMFLLGKVKTREVFWGFQLEVQAEASPPPQPATTSKRKRTPVGSGGGGGSGGEGEAAHLLPTETQQETPDQQQEPKRTRTLELQPPTHQGVGHAAAPAEPLQAQPLRSMSLRGGPAQRLANLTENFEQDLLNVYGQYAEAIVNVERLQLLADAAASQQDHLLHPRSSRARSPESCTELEPDPVQIRALEARSADELGLKFVATFRTMLLRGSGCPSRRSQEQLATVVANNKAHRSALVSVLAADVVHDLRALYPATELRTADPGLGHQAEPSEGGEAPRGPAMLCFNGAGWDPRLVEEIQRWSEEFPEGPGARGTPSRRRASLCRQDFWDIIVSFVDAGKERALSTSRGGGVILAEDKGGGDLSHGRSADAALLMLEQVVAALAEDYKARAEAAGDAVRAMKGSLLARLLERGDEIHRRRGVPHLVRSLTATVGGLTEQGGDQEMLSHGRLRDSAASFLQMILDHYSRQSNPEQADKHVCIAFLQDIPESKHQVAFLAALPPHDRGRLIARLLLGDPADSSAAAGGLSPAAWQSDGAMACTRVLQESAKAPHPGHTLEGPTRSLLVAQLIVTAADLHAAGGGSAADVRALRAAAHAAADACIAAAAGNFSRPLCMARAALDAALPHHC